MRILAMPYAGGDAHTFQALRARLKSVIQFDIFEYPGHGKKLASPLMYDIHSIAQEMLREFFPICEPYCLLGYSMGGLVLCEVYRLLVAEQYPLPVHVFLCASVIPRQTPQEVTDISDQVLVKLLEESGGTPTEVLQNRGFMEMLLPIYRADIIAYERYALPNEPLFTCGGTVIIGEKRKIRNKAALEWKKYFYKPVRFRFIKGGHFFIQKAPKSFARIVNTTVKKLEMENKYV